MTLPFPSTGKTKDEVLAIMRAARDHDVQWKKGRAFSLVYHAGKDVDDLLKEASLLFFSENGLNPAAVPSLRKFETEIVAMAASLLGDENAVGTVTSGGTESLLMTVKTARDWARKNRPEIQHPEMILPISVHPAFEKGSEYFGMKAVRTPLRADSRADAECLGGGNSQDGAGNRRRRMVGNASKRDPDRGRRKRRASLDGTTSTCGVDARPDAEARHLHPG